MVSLTTYIKDEIRIILWTKLHGREYTVVDFMSAKKGDSVMVRELKAIILGLSHMNKPSEIEIYVGNQMTVTALNDWVKKWQQDGWVKTNGKPVQNKELWQQIMKLLEEHTYKAKLKGEMQNE